MTRRDPKDTETLLRRLAGEQAGYFTAHEALSAGYTYRQQHFHRERGNWLQVDRGVFRFPDFPSSEHEDIVRWTLWTRDRKGLVRGIISHDTALALHELCDIDPAKVHMTVPPNFRPRPPGGCRLHRASLTPRDIEDRPGFRITSPRRTLLDVANTALSPELLGQAVETALERGLVLRRELDGSSLTASGRKRLMAALGVAPTR